MTASAGTSAATAPAATSAGDEPLAALSKEAAAPPPPDPITRRARMKVSEYRGSAFFKEDHPFFGSRVIIGASFLIACGYFSLPWSLAGSWPRPTLVEIVHYSVAWGAVPIFVLAFWAVTYARTALAEFGVNTAIARHVERSAAAKLQEIRLDPRSRGTVSRLGSDHLPDNASHPPPASLRLFQRICVEALDRRFESTINLIEPYQRESMEPVLKLEGIQRAALRWGILCHFIGLVLVINAVPAMMRPAEAVTTEPTAQPIGANTAPDATVAAASEGAIEEVLDGLRLAFGASVGGLSVSIFTAMLLSSVRQRQFAYFRTLDEATSTMISLATNSLNNDELLASLQHVSERLHDQTITVKEGIQTLTAAIASQARTIDGGLQSLGDGKLKLDEFLGNLSRSHDEFLTHLNACYDVSALSAASNRVARQIETSEARTIDALATEIVGVRRAVSDLGRSANRLDADPLRFLPHAFIALAGISALTLLVLLWRLP